jgi:hypothetical protein
MATDGTVGPGTRAAMNVPVEARIDQIRVNLERGRWVLHEIKGEFVLVDVAGFYVSYFREDEPIWTSRVVVGRDERETPIFRSQITYVVFNPTWTIPPGILVKDKLPELRRDAGALKRMNIRVLDGSGREVNPYSIDWTRYGPGRLPPTSSARTPDPTMHSAWSRSCSEPLPRVPARFAREIAVRPGSAHVQLGLYPGATAARARRARAGRPGLEAAVDPGRHRREADPHGHVAEARARADLYWTAQPRPDGQIAFRKDVYGRDPATLAALNSAFRVPNLPPRQQTTAAPAP